ncbi:MAG: alkylhydroperoxidase domain protein [Gluconobacter potus]|uniref:Alkylhydroperoxidase n=1 Tax=Gluconobacter potus TaxID=2724927 RepID=A0A149QW86_9PROT|nr:MULTISPECIES: alkylhydroperoxidase domain protein [Gluconobacter]KXV01424.1 alkylhydroperoxidase [Gluconobacter potus]MBF0851369.1 alkylhydroperoxidase domain protein [Gluconobacter sp. R75690]MBF0865354.1 alkylhydroperoxidase domain protein [Gluconobacter sp. R71656]MBF0868881.1 alkylhydroperoxidase domain protein [Gluconobacter sp. R75628]MBF0874842.1 alkylhydroperoxidase domain protein [Gluconobacter sp. R75629]
MSVTPQNASRPDNREPARFTTALLDWHPWLPPLEESELTEVHYDGLVDRARAKSPYFMLLARDPQVLGARTRSDRDIFYNTDGGLPRRERELAATAVSRFNGCIYCASVHARFSERQGGSSEALAVLLATGSLPVDATEAWLLVAEVARQISETPVGFSDVHVRVLRQAGFNDAEILDLINASSFFNWANRLMLSLGYPTLPVEKQD